MTERSQTLPWWLRGGGGVETTENKNTLAPLGTEQGYPLEKLTEISTKITSLLKLL
jgi:hypothetical protein